MDKFIGILLLLSVTFVKCQKYDEDGKAAAPLNYSIEELFLRDFLDQVKPNINTIVEKWKRNGYSENMSDGFIEKLVEAYAQRFPPTPPLLPEAIDSFTKHVGEFKTCIDQTLAGIADDSSLKMMVQELQDAKNTHPPKNPTPSSYFFSADDRVEPADPSWYGKQ